MSSKTHRCPDCGGPLVANRLTPIRKIEGIPAASSGGFYLEILECDNRMNHRTGVPCPHDCGETVPYPQAHYSEPIEGLVGPGRWNCASKAEREGIREFLAGTSANSRPIELGTGNDPLDQERT